MPTLLEERISNGLKSARKALAAAAETGSIPQKERDLALRRAKSYLEEIDNRIPRLRRSNQAKREEGERLRACKDEIVALQSAVLGLTVFQEEKPLVEPEQKEQTPEDRYPDKYYKPKGLGENSLYEEILGRNTVMRWELQDMLHTIERQIKDIEEDKDKSMLEKKEEFLPLWLRRLDILDEIKETRVRTEPSPRSGSSKHHGLDNHWEGFVEPELERMLRLRDKR
ncbi:Uncharacterised protein [Candidatus Anstonella stagnisolia]|nr:Uncharacterised protein [Candidatus Anstonella stagnisolia]